jgi:hypothetical protein
MDHLFLGILLRLMRRYAPLHTQREAALRLRNDKCIFNFVEVLSTLLTSIFSKVFNPTESYLELYLDL